MSFCPLDDFFRFSKKLGFGYSWSTLLWYRCYYPHRSRDALSPVFGIFLLLSITTMFVKFWQALIDWLMEVVAVTTWGSDPIFIKLHIKGSGGSNLIGLVWFLSNYMHVDEVLLWLCGHFSKLLKLPYVLLHWYQAGIWEHWIFMINLLCLFLILSLLSNLFQEIKISVRKSWILSYQAYIHFRTPWGTFSSTVYGYFGSKSPIEIWPTSSFLQILKVYQP